MGSYLEHKTYESEENRKRYKEKLRICLQPPKKNVIWVNMGLGEPYP